MGKINVRRAGFRDYGRIHVLKDKCYDEMGASGTPNAVFRPCWREIPGLKELHIAFDGEIPVGMIGLSKRQERVTYETPQGTPAVATGPCLKSAFVVPEHRKGGKVFKALLEHAVTEAGKRRGVERVLALMNEGDFPVRVGEEHGWKRVGTSPEHGVDLIVKQLKTTQ